MKTLILLRHAKSDWSGSNIFLETVSDIERPLSKKGYEACRKISQFFVSTKLRVDLAEYSSARRATDTFNAIKESLHFSFQRQNSKLYTFNAKTLLHVISNTSDKVETYLLVGHNPAIEDLISELVPPDHNSKDLAILRSKYPTGAIAFLKLNIFKWNELTPNCGCLKAFLRPRDI